MTIATIIPFFQRSRGILARTVEIALSQHGVDRQLVVVVDDGSPVPARNELQEAGLGKSPNVLVLDKPNGGAASARNYGLDHLPDTIAMVAFLDSDDRWPAQHLFVASAALSRGFDFYFADHRRDDWQESKFQRIGFDPATMPAVPGLDSVRAFTTPLAPFCMLRHGVQTSTVVVRRDFLGDLRFPETLPLLEDDTTWSALAQNGARICFCEHVEAVNGAGINISLARTRTELMRKTLDLYRAWRDLPRFLVLDQELAEGRQTRMRLLLKEYARMAFVQPDPNGARERLARFSGYDPAALAKGLWYLAFDRALMRRSNRST